MQTDHDFFEDAPCGYVILSPDGALLSANRAFRDLTELASDSLQECRFQDFLSRAGCMFYETQFAQVILLREKLSEIAFDLIGSDGQIIPVLVNAILRRDEAGAPRDILMAVFNASHRRAYEQDLIQARKTADQMVEVIRHSSDAILTLSTEGRIRTWNKGAEEVFGYAPSEAKGKLFLDLLFEQAPHALAREAELALGLGKSVNREVIGLHKDGHGLDLSISLTPHMEAPGILIAYSAIIRDVSAQKAAERALMQSEKLASVGRLASSIAHEINNPLEAVTNLLYILKFSVDSEETKAFVETAQEELARVSQIVTHTLRFHRQSTSPAYVDLGDLLTSVVSLYRARLRDSGIEVEVKRSDASPLYCFDGELRQILMNLVGNAFDATRSGGRLMLSFRDATSWSSGRRCVRITIADSGSGISSKLRSRIFDAFFTTKGIGGTGLGLWIAQELIQKNNGYIRVKSSTRPGRSGTVFVLTFPHLDS